MEFLCIINVNLPNNGMLYFGLIDAKIRASDIDLPLPKATLSCQKVQTKSKQSPGNNSELPDCLLNMKSIQYSFFIS